MNFVMYFRSYVEQLKKIDECLVGKLLHFGNSDGYSELLPEFYLLRQSMKDELSELKNTCTILTKVRMKIEPSFITISPRIKKHENFYQTFLSDADLFGKKLGISLLATENANQLYLSKYKLNLKNLGLTNFQGFTDIEKIIEQINTIIAN